MPELIPEEEPQNVWLECALELRKLVEAEPESVQQSHHEMDTGWLRYPEYRRAKRERGEWSDDYE